jgi:hypothetical protein
MIESSKALTGSAQDNPSVQVGTEESLADRKLAHKRAVARQHAVVSTVK